MTPSPHAAPHIRASADADLPAIAAIYRHHVTTGLASFEETPPDAEELARRRAAVLGSGLPWLVATDAGGAVLGYAYAGLYRPRSAYRYTVEDSIYVAPGQTGRGVGRALLAALIADTEAKGYRQMMAVIGDSANHASIGVHRACGFIEAGRLRGVGFKFGRWVDSVLMQRALGDGAMGVPAGPPGAR
ncbi:MAG: N-acetyltransferase family protein [Acetobacteraceae bacterium]|jgi:phosphinothricin acetyltransferase|nr:N-acetyltransferase family protein [Acetobacteraceae bacterium]